ncbi:MAG: AMP-binding protein [Clostridia bacterium]|nr:AMP-binding protein [Clostridia bacterium]
MSDYAQEVASFRWQVPERFNFARDTFDAHAQTTPERMAMLWVDDEGHEQKISFGRFRERSRRLASALLALGLRPGDRLLLLLPRRVAWWESVLAALRAGVVFSPGTTQLTARDIAYRLRAAEVAAVITDPENAPKVDEALAEAGGAGGGWNGLRARILVEGEREGWLGYEELVEGGDASFEGSDTRADDPAVLFFTSGTTGYPKMTLHTQASNGIGHYVTGAYWLDLKPDDLHWNLSDTGWAKAAWSSFFGPWIMGAAVFVHHTARFNARRTLEMLARYPVTTLCAAPTNYRMLVQEDLAAFRFPSLRHCVAAGEPLNPEVIETWRRATGLTIRDGYGQTETVVCLANFPCTEVRPGSMGKPVPGFDVAVIDEEGRELPPGQEGDVAIRVRPERPVGLFREYWKDPERTAQVFRGDWYLTGDRAYRDEDGYFWFVGRADDVILSAAYRIGPFEIESVLLEHPAVAESAVVGSPDPVRGQIVKAFVVLARGWEPSEELARQLQEFVKERTAPYKYPREIEFVDDLPKTVSGKIRRVELRQREMERKGGAAPAR